MGTLEQATCIYHPGKPAASTCKQCGKTTCSQCTVTGPTGTFCSTPCRTAHEARVVQAKDANGRARSTFFVKFRGILTKLVILGVLLAVGIWVTKFIYIPGLSEFSQKILGILGL